MAALLVQEGEQESPLLRVSASRVSMQWMCSHVTRPTTQGCPTPSLQAATLAGQAMDFSQVSTYGT